MSTISIRESVSSDLAQIKSLDHACTTEYVWQMEYQQDEGQVAVNFKSVRLPRPVLVDYPRDVSRLHDGLRKQELIYVAQAADVLVGYIRLVDMGGGEIGWISDLVVAPRFRRQGHASQMILSVQAWMKTRKFHWMMIEMSTKQYGAICLAQKMGFDFCGYNDRYYTNKDIALFFGRSV